jgi:hypothetical protein
MVLSITIIKQKILGLAEEFVKQKRLKSVDEIFDLKVEDIIKAEKNKKLDLQKIRAKHLKEYETWQ